MKRILVVLFLLLRCIEGFSSVKGMEYLDPDHRPASVKLWIDSDFNHLSLQKASRWSGRTRSPQERFKTLPLR